MCKCVDIMQLFIISTRKTYTMLTTHIKRNIFGIFLSFANFYLFLVMQIFMDFLVLQIFMGFMQGYESSKDK